MKRCIDKNHKELPLVSIVTVVYNAEEHIEETIKSIINQTYYNIEYIIIDGGSTDKTKSIINKYTDRIDYFISEPDKGIYDAMNKGIKIATGEWINFMNAGDTFYNSNVLQSIFSRKDTYKYKLIYGNVNAFHKEYGINKIVGREMDVNDIYMKMPTSHQAIFCNSQAFKEIGVYNTDYKVIGDYEWFVRFYKKYRGKELWYINIIISNYSIEGFSTQNTLSSAEEKLKLYSNHFPYLNKRKETLKYYIRLLRALIVKHIKAMKIYHIIMKYNYKE